MEKLRIIKIIIINMGWDDYILQISSVVVEIFYLIVWVLELKVKSVKQNYKVVQQSKEKVFKKTLKILMYCFCVILVKFVSTTRLRRLYVYLYGDEFPLKSLLQPVFKWKPS